MFVDASHYTYTSQQCTHSIVCRNGANQPFIWTTRSQRQRRIILAWREKHCMIYNINKFYHILLGWKSCFMSQPLQSVAKTSIVNKLTCYLDVDLEIVWGHNLYTCSECSLRLQTTFCELESSVKRSLWQLPTCNHTSHLNRHSVNSLRWPKLLDMGNYMFIGEKIPP